MEDRRCGAAVPGREAFVSAIVLAAGESARMGRQKALVEWHGMPLIAYQLEQLSSIDAVRQIVVVTGHEPETIAQIAGGFAKAAVAHNPAYASGKAGSILTGLHAIAPQADTILLLAVDQPRPAAIVRTIIDRHLAEAAAITAPVHAGRRGHPIVFARTVLPELLEISEETQGVRAVLGRHDADVLEVEVDDPIVRLDLNRPDDLPRIDSSTT